MGKYAEALIAAGIMKEQIFGGLKPTRFAKRVHLSGKNRTVTDGPFTETKELVARLHAVGREVHRRSRRVGEEVPRDNRFSR